MSGGIVYLAMLSAVCRVQLDELCQDANCECTCHDTDDLESLFDDAADDASILHAEARFEASRDD